MNTSRNRSINTDAPRVSPRGVDERSNRFPMITAQFINRFVSIAPVSRVNITLALIAAPAKHLQIAQFKLQLGKPGSRLDVIDVHESAVGRTCSTALTPCTAFLQGLVANLEPLWRAVEGVAETFGLSLLEFAQPLAKFLLDFAVERLRFPRPVRLVAHGPALRWCRERAPLTPMAGGRESVESQPVGVRRRIEPVAAFTVSRLFNPAFPLPALNSQARATPNALRSHQPHTASDEQLKGIPDGIRLQAVRESRLEQYAPVSSGASVPKAHRSKIPAWAFTFSGPQQTQQGLNSES